MTENPHDETRTMRAITVVGPGELQFAELSEPIPGPGEVLVDVVAAGVNRADLAQAAGKYPPPPGASELLGLEVSGRRRDTGEEVVALLAGGGYAEVVAVPEELLLPAPEGLSLIEAAGVVEAAATVVSNLVLEAGIREGETLLVHGGTGGIGTVAIQIATQMDARVLTTVGSDEALPIVERLGAAQAWNRRIIDLPAAVRETGGADVILDVVGGSTLADNVAMLNKGGRLVIIGTLGGASGELPIGQLMAKGARVIGSMLRPRPLETKASILEATRYLVWPLLASGALQIPIHERVPLAEAARAHEILSTGGHVGKVILEVEEPADGHRRGRRRRSA